MQGFIHIFKLDKNYTYDVDIEAILKRYKAPSLNVFETKNENITSVYFTNEYTEYPYGQTETGMFTPVGIFTREIEEIKNSLMNSEAPDKLNYVRNLEGQFAIGYSDYISNQINVFTHVARIETVYAFTSNDSIIIGTDPLIISLIATNGNVDFSLPALHSFILNGYYADDGTPFKDVYALPGNSHIKVDENGLEINEIDNLYSNLLNKEYGKSDYDDLTDLFINAFNTQPKDKEFRLALTGGKDSRLIFAAMNSNNFDLSVFTNGFDDNPDVVIAKRIADMYELEHRSTSPKISEENTISVNIYSKIKRVMLATSGMVYGYENVGSLGKFTGHKSFDGIGAELVKGGFANFINADENSNKLKLVNTFNRNHQLLKNGKDNPFGDFLLDFIDDEQGLHKLQILYSLKYRTGRLTSAAKNAANYSRQSHSPFLDNKFLREALKIQYADNKNEEIHYQIMKRIDKRLIDIPFAKDRWRVEKTKPMTAGDYDNWLNRQPYYPSTVLGNYNWRRVQNNDKVIIKQFKDILLSNPNHIIYQIIDYKAVNKMISGTIKANHMRFIWSLASIIIFVNELTDVSNRTFNKDINVTLPSTSVSEYKNKKKIVDLTNDFLPLNKSIDISDDNNISIKNFDKHRKLLSFEGKYTEAPNQINIQNISKLSLRVHLNHSENTSKIIGQILFYKDNKLEKTIYLDSEKTNDTTEFHHFNDEINQYDSFRVLLNFNKLDETDTAKLNYAFYEVTY